MDIAGLARTEGAASIRNAFRMDLCVFSKQNLAIGAPLYLGGAALHSSEKPMIEKSSKADQIRKLREERVLAAGRATANRKGEATDDDLAAPEQESKALPR
jgi:hypothetical protein